MGKSRVMQGAKIRGMYDMDEWRGVMEADLEEMTPQDQVRDRICWYWTPIPHDKGEDAHRSDIVSHHSPMEAIGKSSKLLARFR